MKKVIGGDWSVLVHADRLMRTSSDEIFSYEGGNQGRSHLLRRDLLGRGRQSREIAPPPARSSRTREAIKGDRTSSGEIFSYLRRRSS